MTFKEWALLDEDDERILNITLKKRNGQYAYYTSFQVISAKEMLILQNSTLVKAELINNEWEIVLTI